MKHTWRSPEFHGPAVSKVASLVIDDRKMLRQGFENRFVTQLKSRGVTAIPTYDLLSLGEIKEDKPGAGKKFQAAGAEGLLIMRLVDVNMTYREIRPGNERYAAVTTGLEHGYWYDYYSVAYMDMSPTYGSMEHKVALEASLYDLKTAKQLWSGVTQTTLKETTDRVAEMDPIVSKILAAMQKDGVIP